jgi:hypothetical protein|tara:strand:- start:1110 stop:2063 length:954 start_codon:yes stop_codon:yes gene_type:complete
MARVKMNNEYRTKISNQVRNALDHDKLNSKREAYLQHLELVKEQYPKFFDEAKAIVKRSYPKEHCDTLNHFKNLYGSPCDVVAKDSCYYFAYTDNDMSEDDYNNNEVKKHFDFKLRGNLNGSEYDNQDNFAYAYYRDEMIEKNLNPDINIEQEDNHNNPHWTKHVDANKKFIKEVENNFNDSFACDVIGISYCRSRAIACTKEEFQRMNEFIQMKSNLVKYHQEWQRGIREDMKDIKASLKLIRNLDEGIELANKTFEALDIDVRLEESQIIRSNSTGITLYSPENVASRIAERRKAKPTREEKIALYQEQQSSVMN